MTDPSFDRSTLTDSPTLARLGWDDDWAAAAAEAADRLRLPDDVRLDPGRVVRADRGGCELLVEAPSGLRPLRTTWGADIVAVTVTDPTAVPAAGDWGLVATWPDDRSTIEVLLPRRTAVVRAQVAAGSTQGQVLAANSDVVAVVEGMEPDPDAGRIERLLALAWSSGGQPLVVLTKADLVGDPDALVGEVSDLAPGCEVLATAAASSTDGPGLACLRELLGQGSTVALLGASGVGKSTLLNALVGGDAMVTRALRADGKGRHTTVTRELHLAPGGGAVLDTPGLRTVGLVGREAVEEVFTDVEALAERCRFNDCAHDSEPGCAVVAALEAGELTERRLASYRKLRREIEWQASRTDSRLRAERARAWKRIAAQNRRRIPRP